MVSQLPRHGRVIASPTPARNRAVATLIAHGPTYRADLARQLDVSRTTVTQVTSELLAAGLVTIRTTKPGPALKESVALTPLAGLLATVVYLPTEVLATVATLDAGVEVQQCEAIDKAATGQRRLQIGIGLVQGLLRRPEFEGGVLRGAYLAVNTKVDTRTGIVQAGPAWPGWRGVNPHAVASRAFGLPVRVENTTRLRAFGEYVRMPDPRPANLVYVHLAEGVGYGQIIDGQIVAGSHGGGGELGHLSIDPDGPVCTCGNRGCLQTYAGSEAVRRRASQLLGREVEPRELAPSVRRGVLPTLVDEVGTAVGRGVTALCNLLDPEVVVVGGELTSIGCSVVDPIRREVMKRALPVVTSNVRIVAGECGDRPEALAESALVQLRRDARLVDAVLTQLDVSLAPTVLRGQA